MTPEGLEERLEAAADSASQDAALDLDLGHPGSALDAARRRGAHEEDLDPLH